MSVRVSIATGNWLTAGTWGLVNAESYSNSETNVSSLTTLYSGTRSAAFTTPVGAITVSHLCVKLSVRTGTTGTMSVSLRNATIGLDDFVAGTEVTINCADLPVSATTDLNGGWISFKLATPVILLTSTNYNIQAKTSTTAQVSLNCDGTTDNLSRCLVTTTTGAPAAGDDLIVAGELTGAGTSNAFVVTMDGLASAITDYGAASTSLVIPALAICHLGTLSFGSTAATAYYLRLSGHAIVYSGGLFNIGTVATPIPRNSSAILNFDCGANVDFGLTVRNLGTFVAQGLSRTVSKDIYYCKLNTDEAAAQTVLGVDTDTGWLSGDEIVIASTSRTGSETELRTLSGDAGASSMTVTAGLTNAHSGTSPTQAEVINLTRNVKIVGVSATVQTYIDIKATAVVDIDWVEFKWLGSGGASKRGIDVTTTTGSCSIRYCSLHDFVVVSSYGVITAGTASNNFTLQHIVSYNVITNLNVVVTTGTNWVVDNWIALAQPLSGNNIVFAFADVGGTITNLTAAGCPSTGSQISITEVGGVVGTINNLTVHSAGGSSSGGLLLSSFYNGSISNITVWRMGGSGGGLLLTSLDGVTVDGITLFGNLTTNMVLSGGYADVILKNAVVSGDTSFATLNGITFSTSSGGIVTIEDSTFGGVSGIKTAHTRDILPVINGSVNLDLQNVLLASATEVLTPSTLMPPGVVYGSQKHDQVSGSNKAFKREGTITTDTTIFDTTPSVRITPNLATEKCECPVLASAVASGNALTVSVKVRESVAGDGTDYNGNRIRLIVKRNAAAGIAADTVLATATAASEGAFETIQGTTVAVSENAVLEFVVDCDGTTGWINADTPTVDATVSTLGLAYWKSGRPLAYGNNSAGGGSGPVPRFGQYSDGPAFRGVA